MSATVVTLDLDITARGPTQLRRDLKDKNKPAEAGIRYSHRMDPSFRVVCGVFRSSTFQAYFFCLCEELSAKSPKKNSLNRFLTDFSLS